ncbi:MAG: GIY-YIG nuclease family protein [Myxococcales bacterium]|nr:GIY-YIG nuclease family protein [Myxococcales bacterium]MDD9965305.1 GIY-YIG nuclease family protein [Myxococcales bacterium]
MLRRMPEYWFVYVLVSSRLGRTYVGVSNAPTRRLQQHNGEQAGGAKATRAGRPWQIAALYGPYTCRADAQRTERSVKALRGKRRLGLLALAG